MRILICESPVPSTQNHPLPFNQPPLPPGYFVRGITRTRVAQRVQSQQITIMAVWRAWEFDLLIIGPQRDSSPNIFAPRLPP